MGCRFSTADDDHISGVVVFCDHRDVTLGVHFVAAGAHATTGAGGHVRNRQASCCELTVKFHFRP